MIRRGLLLFFFSCCINPPLFAEANPPLVVAVEPYFPPFVYNGGKQLLGFDISMTEYICKTLQRTCQYKPMRFKYIVETVAENKADIGVSAITITLPRSKMVAFSIPYLLSYAQYVTRGVWRYKPFHENDLNGKRIGILKGSVFEGAILAKHFTDVDIKQYDSTSDLVDALSKASVDFILMDAPSARYWQIQTDNKVVAVGPPFAYGYGFGIAVNAKRLNLLSSINSALLAYQNKGGFEQAYTQYLAPFS